MFVLHGKALVVKSRGQTSKYSVLTVRLGHSLRFAVPSFSPSFAPIMQAFAPVVGFSLPGTPGTKPVENGGRLPSVQFCPLFLHLPSTGATIRLLQYERSPPMPAAAQAAITLPRTVTTPPRLGFGSACFRADLQVFSSAILNMLRRRPAVTSPLLPCMPDM